MWYNSGRNKISMSLKLKILLATGIAITAIQFIQPVHKNTRTPATDILNIVNIPDSVQSVLKIACYDCHSNNTRYPWYSTIQPVGWLISHHIIKAREELNFSEFGSYSQRRQISKLDGIANSINDDIMPLPSYKLMHKNAQLSAHEKVLIINWARQSKDSLSAIN